MAVMQSRDNRTYIAGADLSAAQFKFVKTSGANVVVASTAGEQCIGVCLIGGASGTAVTVVRSGSVMVTSGATISAGAAVSTDASGFLKAAATGNIIMGYAREAAVSGQVIEIELISGGNAA